MITDATSKVDLPATAGRGNEQTDAVDIRLPATRTQSESEHSVTAAPDRAAIVAAVGKVREALHTSDSRLQIDIDPDLDRVVVQVINGDTGEVIRQIPAKELLELAKNIHDRKGVLFQEHA